MVAQGVANQLQRNCYKNFIYLAGVLSQGGSLEDNKKDKTSSSLSALFAQHSQSTLSAYLNMPDLIAKDSFHCSIAKIVEKF
jgi:hypothetical protein